MPTPYRLAPLEIASGLVLARSRPRPLPRPAPGSTPRDAFEQAILPALWRPPCLVSFSGGRASTAVLAVAASLARRHGLPLPIPVTHRFASTGTRESAWQEQVVRHLGLREWITLEAGDELGCLGPVATAELLRHGLLWPCDAYVHAPLLDAACGGSLVTGVGGGEAFSPPVRAHGPVPRSVERPLIRRRLPELAPWLRPHAQRTLERTIAAEAARVPLGWAARHRALHGAAATNALLSSLDALASARDVRIAHPFASAPFLGSLAALPRSSRHRTRSESMAALAGDLLPSEPVSHSAEARSGDALWTEPARELIAGWTGDGIDHVLVDAERLMEEWASAAPARHTVTLLQSVWLSRARAAAPTSPGATRARAAG